ncbi:MAG TPA: VWA domain-containing protein [Terriglobales bacterium]|nr:VWA domain-containing protein [Terriglobales bacterium]
MIEARDIEATGAARTIVSFCRFARQQGLSTGLPETLGALQATAVLGAANTDELKLGLRAVLCSSKEDWDLFEKCFRSFWERSSQLRATSQPSPSGGRRQESVTSGIDRGRVPWLMSTGAAENPSREQDGAQAVTGASARERLSQADLSTLSQADLAVLEQISARLFRQMSRRLARRRSCGLRGQVDLRRTIRGNISHGGDPINLRFRRRKLRPYRLVTLLDISGSMSAYSMFLVKFLYALQRHFRHVDTFLFSTRLTEITGLFRAPCLSGALAALSQWPAGWSGGTNIGGSLREFNQLHCRKLRSADTLFIILSDGWDTGDVDVLERELGAIKRRVRKLIWLNPLLGLDDYQPITGGMRAALPHLDVFAPAHNLESLLALERHL